MIFSHPATPPLRGEVRTADLEDLSPSWAVPEVLPSAWVGLTFAPEPLYLTTCRALMDEVEYDVTKARQKKTKVGSFRVNPDGTQERRKSKRPRPRYQGTMGTMGTTDVFLANGGPSSLAPGSWLRQLRSCVLE
ncbi:hypothetical protein CB1_000880032 [Camelus ferus]|nr:hypothetical protein CB1_000880032 [Camelus ferus]